jgi:hypothetical protein
MLIWLQAGWKERRMDLNSFMEIARFCLTIMHRLPMQAFEPIDETTDPAWLTNLYHSCGEILTMRSLPSADLESSVYTNVCDVLVICVTKKFEIRASLAVLEQAVWQKINDLLVRVDLVSVRRVLTTKHVHYNVRIQPFWWAWPPFLLCSPQDIPDWSWRIRNQRH